MSTTQFLWLVFGGWIVLLAAAAIAQLKRPHRTSFGPAMLTLSVVTGAATLGKAGVWWALGVAAMGLIGYLALCQIVKISLQPPR